MILYLIKNPKNNLKPMNSQFFRIHYQNLLPVKITNHNEFGGGNGINKI